MSLNMSYLEDVEQDNPYQVLGRVEPPSKPTVRKAEFLRGERKSKKRMPSPVREQEIITGWIG